MCCIILSACARRASLAPRRYRCRWEWDSRGAIRGPSPAVGVTDRGRSTRRYNGRLPGPRARLVAIHTYPPRGRLGQGWDPHRPHAALIGTDGRSIERLPGNLSTLMTRTRYSNHSQHRLECHDTADGPAYAYTYTYLIISYVCACACLCSCTCMWERERYMFIQQQSVRRLPKA